jgi:hypothetical protein
MDKGTHRGSIALSAIAVAALVAGLVLFRFELVPTGAHKAYQLDRWTGAVQLIDNEFKADVTPEFKPPPQDTLVK